MDEFLNNENIETATNCDINNDAVTAENKIANL